MFDFIHVQFEEEYAHAAILFKEYADWLHIDLSFQHFDEELTALKRMYAAPQGTIILCKKEKMHIACVAVRPINAEIAELKRMYVKSDYQHNGIGQTLLKKSIKFAKEAGYQKIRLDTLNTMIPAMNLYEKNGFNKIPAYYNNPEPTAVYFEKQL